MSAKIWIERDADGKGILKPLEIDDFPPGTVRKGRFVNYFPARVIQ